MKRIILTASCISSLLSASIEPSINDYMTQYGKQVACYATASVAAYSGFKWFTTPEIFKPTLETIHATTITRVDKSDTQTTIHDYMEELGNKKHHESQDIIISKTKNCIVHAKRGVDLSKTPAEQPVFVFSPYFLPILIKHPNKLSFYPPSNPGRALYAAGNYLPNKAIPSTCITFEYRDTRAALNVGQELDQQCLKMVTDEVIKQNHKCVLFGACRGSANILAFLTEQPKEYIQNNISAAIIEAAPFSLKEICAQTMRGPVLNWFPHKAGSVALYALFKFVFPNHKDQEAQILEKIDTIPTDLPLLIIHVKGDAVASDQNIQSLLQRLLETHHKNVHLLLFDNKKLDHYTLSTAPIYASAVNAFLEKYGLPHDSELAKAGRTISSIAKPLVCSSHAQAEKYIHELWNTQALNPDGTAAHAALSSK